MDVRIETPQAPTPVDRAWAVSMVIRSFKGRRDVEVHLYRPDCDAEEAEAYDWDALLGEVLPNAPAEPEASRQVLLEAFTQAERDAVMEYLARRYADRVRSISASALEFPIPRGLPPLSGFPEGKSIGKIRFEKIPNYGLPFVVHGLYDLSRHKPLVEEEG